MATDRSLRLLDKLASEGRTAFIASEVQDVLAWIHRLTRTEAVRVST
jgi:hypothetical protein